MTAVTVCEGRAAYILPLKWPDDRDITDLAEYLAGLVDWIDVVFVDGSSVQAREAHAALLPEGVLFLPCEDYPCANGKVAGVLTALQHVNGTRVIIADDDVRYSKDVLVDVLDALERTDLVVPQNYFVAAPGERFPWHAHWDTARSLLNRAAGGDYPGTLGVRTSYLRGGYDGDVLFENLELIRTVKARGGKVTRALDMFIPRKPPTVRGFLNQRVRQAYDSFAQPARLTGELLVLPTVVIATRRPGMLIGLALAAMLMAEAGRQRHSGTQVYSTLAAGWAPLWMLERGVCAWIALALRMRGGVNYHGQRLIVAAHSQRYLEKKEKQ